MSWGYKPVKGRISLHEQKLRNQKAMDTYADLAEKPRVSIDVGKAPVKRAASGANGVVLEKHIQHAILHMLRWRKDIVFFGRFNRGTSLVNDASGGQRRITFNTVPGFPDIHGMLINGRAFYIEVKRPGGKVSEEQAEFIAKVIAGNGIAGVAYSVDDAERLLNSASPYTNS